MHLFVDYIHPLTNWLQDNPSWALFITFLISLTESLAVIGSIIPGSITMTAIGILAGSGIMRIDLTLLAAILGAITGDSASYALGYFYSDKLLYVWPFKKYPAWLEYGKEFFAKHGGKSVLLGRFVGPLRSLIPVIAGIMHMKQWRFLVANFLSAIGWSILYVMPGVLIGAASNELSTESATRLFLLILIVLVGIWAASVILKYIIGTLNALLKKHLHDFWLWLKDHPKLFQLVNLITPEDEENHYPTVALLLATLVTLIGFFSLILIVLETQWLEFINIPVHLFLQSFQTELLNVFFIICTQFTSYFMIISIFVLCCGWFIYRNNFILMAYLFSVITVTFLITALLTHIINSPRPVGLMVSMTGSSFPVRGLDIATAFWGFLLFLIEFKYSQLTTILRAVILLMLGLSGLSAIYLGDYWLSDVIGAYLLGLSVCLLHWLFYRKSERLVEKEPLPIAMLIAFFVAIVVSISLSIRLNFTTLRHNHIPHQKQHNLTEAQWWNQLKPILPLYRYNRIGNRVSLLNLQYAGDLDQLKLNLEQTGWEPQLDTFFSNLLLRMSNDTNEVNLPLLAQLYKNRRPELIMTYQDKASNLKLVLRFWISNYNLIDQNNPIWIGSVHPDLPEHTLNNKVTWISPDFNPTTYILPALNSCKVRRIELHHQTLKKTTLPSAAFVLVIDCRD